MQASGRLENLQTGTARTFQTDANGTYTFGNLSNGRYRLEVSSQGFASQSVLVNVQSGTPISRTISMALGTACATVDVVATTPLAGSDLALREIPAPVQTATQQDLQNSSALDLSDVLNRRLSAVNVNENQENPFQPDVNYRGYYSLTSARHASRPLHLYGRSSAQPAVWRCGELGLDPTHRDRGGRLGAGVQSAFRSQCPR